MFCAALFMFCGRGGGGHFYFFIEELHSIKK